MVKEGRVSETKIELEYPYNKDWKFGYLVTNPEGRKTVILYNSHTDRSSTQYARYLLAVRIERYLTSDEEADHRDDDFTNDDINNLQILSKEGNQNKKYNRMTATRDVPCANCGNVFTYALSEIKDRQRRGVEDICCSRSCATKYQIKNTEGSCIGKQISQENIDIIKKMKSEGCSIYKISKELGVSWSTVLKYCNL